MRTALIVAGALSGLATLLGIALLLYGVVVLIIGKIRLGGKRLRGKPARLAALFFVGQVVVALLIGALLHEPLEWGYAENALQSNIGTTIIFFLCALIGWRAAVGYARGAPSAEAETETGT
jgi:hypothetical protein